MSPSHFWNEYTVVNERSHLDDNDSWITSSVKTCKGIRTKRQEFVLVSLLVGKARKHVRWTCSATLWRRKTLLSSRPTQSPHIHHTMTYFRHGVSCERGMSTLLPGYGNKLSKGGLDAVLCALKEKLFNKKNLNKYTFGSGWSRRLNKADNFLCTVGSGELMTIYRSGRTPKYIQLGSYSPGYPVKRRQTIDDNVSVRVDMNR